MIRFRSYLGIATLASLLAVSAGADDAPAVVEVEWLQPDGALAIVGVEEDDGCCKAVPAGDLNGDGLQDLALVAPLAHRGSFWRGVVFVVLGTDPPAQEIDLTTLDGSNGFVVHGYYWRNELGRETGIGDVNGDGFDDLVLGSGLYGDEAYVVFGAPTFPAEIYVEDLDGNDGFTVFGFIDAITQFGMGAAAGFDLNGDGTDDFVFGDKQHSEGYVIFGRPTFPATFDVLDLDGENGFTIEGPFLLGDFFSGVEDFNGDGMDDLAMTDPGGGKSYVLFGRDRFPSRVHVTELTSETGLTLSGDRLDSEIVDVGDFNGDGLRDLAVGATDDGGRVYVVFGRRDLPAEIDVTGMTPDEGTVIVEDELGRSLGWRLRTPGDTNGDGLDDLAIGVRGDPSNERDGSGMVYVVYGTTDPGLEFPVSSIDGANGFRVFGPARPRDDLLLGGAGGDFNRDGKPDLFVYQSQFDGDDCPNEICQIGRAFLIFEPHRPTVHLEMTGACPGEVTREVSFVAPFHRAGLYQSTSLGTTVVNEGPCAGAILDLEAAELRGLDLADANGNAVATAALGAELCPMYVQYLDPFTCKTTEALAVPGGGR